MADKKIHIMNDFVSCEEYCNLNCQYCLSEGAELKENHNFKRVNGKLNFKRASANENLKYTPGQSFKEKIDNTLNNYLEHFDAPIFKISGGEVTIIENYYGILENYSKDFEVLQLLTNGILLNEKTIEKMARLQNICVQLSLDGHTFAMNSCRFESEKLFHHVMKNLELLSQYNINVEIYCVLTSVNVTGFKSFCDFILNKYKANTIIIPFPVRLLGARLFFPDIKQLSPIKRVVLEYEKYQEILPVKRYMEEMIDFLQNGERRTRCYIPAIMSQIFDDGIISPCPNCWTVKIGNINQDIMEVFDRMDNHPMYRLMLSKTLQPEFCQKCFTDYHIFNMYFDDRISIKELIYNRPSLQGPKVLNRLKTLKETMHLTGKE